MPLIPLDIPPGFFRNGTEYQTRGRWYDGNLVRWYERALQAIGGWQKITDNSDNQVLLGEPARGSISWKDDSGIAHYAAGSFCKAWAFVLGELTEITPAGITCGAVDATAIGGGAYGLGAYGAGPYGGVISDTRNQIVEAGTWQFDTFGELLIGCPWPDGGIYEWDLNVANDFVPVTNAPTSNSGVVVTPEGFLVALGAGGDRRKVQWSDQDNRTVWTPTDTNQAGDKILEGGGELMCGARGRGETLIWTETDLWSMRFIGGDLVYQFVNVGANVGIMSRHAHATIGATAYWMGENGFYLYDGYARPLPSDVADYVFSDFNKVQASKVACASLSDFNEVWWFYPSADSIENDRYVVYNYAFGIWYTGELERTTATDRGAHQYPIMVDASGHLYEHEKGTTNLVENRRLSVLRLPGETGDYASAPDTAPLSITGDIDLRAEISADDFTPATAQTLIGKWTASGNQRSYVLELAASGALVMRWSPDGTAILSMASTVSLPGVTDGVTVIWVRATLDVDDGGGNRVANFYWSTDNQATWNQLGATVTVAGVTSIFDSTAVLEIGSFNLGSSQMFAGDVYKAQVLNGIAGTLEFQADFTLQVPGITSFTESSDNAATVTINQSGSPKAEIIQITAPTATQAAIWAETGPVEIGDGDQVMTVVHVVPDDKTLGDVTGTLSFRYHPDGAETQVGPFTLSAQTDVRATGRQVQVRVDQVKQGWRVGRIRLDVRQGGRR